MSHDRDAGGLEQTVQLLDRVFLCRFFHSKTSPVGGLCLKAGPPGCTHRPAQNLTSRHSSQDTPGTTTLKSLPARVRGPRGVEVRTISATRRGTRGVKRNPVFTRLCRPCD